MKRHLVRRIGFLRHQIILKQSTHQITKTKSESEILLTLWWSIDFLHSIFLPSIRVQLWHTFKHEIFLSRGEEEESDRLADMKIYLSMVEKG